MDRAKLEDIFEEPILNGLLDLSNNGLTSLPESIGSLRDITRLNLCNNQLTSIPDGIGNLVSLTRLYLNENHLTSIPDSIGNLVNLEILLLGNNQLASIPNSIANLVNLTRLDLDNNHLSSIPESVGNFINLELLFLDNNNLTNIPDSIGNFVNLIRLDLDNNQLINIPESIGNLIELRELYLDNNKLTNIPESIGNLVKLTRLDLEKNELDSLPASIGKFSKISVLFLDNDRIHNIPSNIRDVAETTRLHVQRIDDFADLLSQPNHTIQTEAVDNILTHLQSLNLKSNDDRSTFVDRVFEAIIARANSDIFSYFCHRFNVIFDKKEPYQRLMFDWLSGLSEITVYSNISRKSILAAQLFFGIDNRTWQEVGELLLNEIDSEDVNIRACAAHQIGKFSNRLFCLWEQPDDDDDFSWMILVPEGNWEWCFEPGSYEKYVAEVNGVPPLAEMFAFFQTKELDRAGVLYPWLSALESVAATNLDISAGVVEILKQSPASAPASRYFPITLRALAQERFCDIDAFKDEMSQVDYQERCIAIRRLIEKLKSFLDRNDYLRVSLVEQIQEVFQVVTNYIDPDTFAVFCFEFHDDLGGNKRCDRLIILWLERLLEMKQHPTLTKDDITAAQIFLGVYNTNWQAVGGFLIAALDSHNPKLRSCAAYQLGVFSNGLYCNLNWLRDDRKISPLNYLYGKYLSAIANYEEYEQKLEGIPPLAEMLDLIGAKEIEHPGLACAWMSVCQVTTDYRDTSDWMINILGKSSTPETFTSYFPLTLGFLAHEWFSDNPVAIRRLIDVGRIDIACAAATDNR